MTANIPTSTKLRWMGAGALLTVLATAITVAIVTLTVDRGRRLPAPPETAHPLGAIDVEEVQNDPNSGLQRSITASFLAEGPHTFDIDQDGIREYDMLALTGGGANGAFGAGFLCGWTAAGTRPDFKVVTGVSTGALQATAAFLGSEYDTQLREIYTLPSTIDIYRKRGALAGLYNDGMWDSEPLSHLIERYITSDVLEAVARKHALGHRLFVGTTNMDTREFVVWDLGAIANSDRPDKLEHYRRILLASASVPVLFPPVYFEVDVEGHSFQEMHADGGTTSQVFLRGFLLDFDDAFIDAGIDGSKTEIELYVIRNGRSTRGRERGAVEPRTIAIASMTIENLFDITMNSGLYRMYVLAHRYGFGFNLAQIPAEYADELDPMLFDPPAMRRLFDVAFELARDGYAWQDAPDGLDPDERFDPENAPSE